MQGSRATYIKYKWTPRLSFRSSISGGARSLALDTFRSVAQPRWTYGRWVLSNFDVSYLLNDFQGLYLGREKVAIKVIRAVTSDPRSLRVSYLMSPWLRRPAWFLIQRFQREVKVWGDIWKIDGGRHILPFYGFCQNDGPYPWLHILSWLAVFDFLTSFFHRYMVSPWQVNNICLKDCQNFIPHLSFSSKMERLSAMSRDIPISIIDSWFVSRLLRSNFYNNAFPQVRGIGEGISILHSMSPPIVHGDIKGVSQSNFALVFYWIRLHPDQHSHRWRREPADSWLWRFPDRGRYHRRTLFSE